MGREVYTSTARADYNLYLPLKARKLLNPQAALVSSRNSLFEHYLATLSIMAFEHFKPRPKTPQPSSRPKPMEVLCLGLSRTGTMCQSFRSTICRQHVS